MRRRVWLAALSLYALAAAADVAAHLGEHQRAGRDWLAPANLAVAVSAGLFWPIDLAAQLLLAR
jgi:hypothetical protein